MQTKNTKGANRVLARTYIGMVRLPHSMSLDQEEVAIDYSIRNEMREHASKIAYVCAYHAITFMTTGCFMTYRIKATIYNFRLSRVILVYLDLFCDGTDIRLLVK